MIRGNKARSRAEKRSLALAAMVACSDDAIVGNDLEGIVVSWNKGAQELYGYTAEEMIGQPISTIVPEHLREESLQFLRDIAAGQPLARHETVRSRKDGSLVQISLIVSPVKNPKGEIIGASTIAHDMSERRRAEEVRERLAAVVESSDDAIIGKSLDGTITAWNPGAENLFGYSAPEALGKSIHMLIPPERANEESEILARIGRGERINHFETVRVQKDGKRIDVSVTISPIRNRDGTIIGASKIARDISERKCAEEELRKSEERFIKAFHSSPLAIVISTPEGRYLDVNQSFLKMVGCVREDVIDHTVEELMFWTRPSQRRDLLRQLQEGGVVKDVSVQFKTSTAGIREGELSWEKIEVEGQPCLLAFIRDITERLHLEAQFRQAQKMEAVGRLAGGVAHDFNNMLSVIIGYSDLSADLTAPESPLKMYLEQIKKASERATLLTRQLLAFSRQQVIFPRILNLNAVVNNLTTMLLSMVGESISVSFRPTTPIGSIKADPGQIEQILMNLVVNARDAMPDGGEIIIQTGHAELDERYVSRHAGFHTGQHVVLTVSDTGCGMDESIKSKIFEPFFTTKDPGLGTGLGLSTVYGIVKQSRGSILVDSQPGKGATFKIYFPRIAAEAERPVPSREVDESPAESETILVVDDDDAVRKVTTSLLVSAGYQIIEASNAEKALEIITASEPGIDLLLTDLIMFGKSGFELFEQAKVIRPDLRSLFISGYTGDLAALRRGLISERTFLAKPFTKVSLLKKVYTVLHSE